MKQSSTVVPIPPKLLHELEVAESLDWSKGMAISPLIDRINVMAAWLRPDSIGKESRAGETFTVRAFRHYQTLGCIDAPERAGQQVVYRFRQLLQGLVIRKLLWGRLPSDRIAWVTSRSDNAGLKSLLLDETCGQVGRTDPTATLPLSQPPEVWRRVTLGPGIELNLHQYREKHDASRTERYLEIFRQILEAT